MRSKPDESRRPSAQRSPYSGPTRRGERALDSPRDPAVHEVAVRAARREKGRYPRFDEVAAAFEAVGGRSYGNSSYRGPCPAHSGTNPNLSLREGPNGEVWLTCFSRGCSALDVLRALGFAPPRPERVRPNARRPGRVERPHRDPVREIDAAILVTLVVLSRAAERLRQRASRDLRVRIQVDEIDSRIRWIVEMPTDVRRATFVQRMVARRR